MEEFKRYLKGISPITDSEFADSMPYFSEKTLRKGDFFIEQDKVCKHAAFIVKGSLRTFYLNENGEETTSCFCTENNFTTSYKSFILQQASNLSLQAMEDTQLLIIDHEHLQKLYAKSTVWQSIGRMVAEKEYLVMEQYASLLNNETAKTKYLRLLKEQPSVLQKAKVEDIASYLGVTRRTLSRIRKEVKGGS